MLFWNADTIIADLYHGTSVGVFVGDLFADTYGNLISLAYVFKAVRNNVVENHFQFLFVKPQHDVFRVGMKLQIDILVIRQFLEGDIDLPDKLNYIFLPY